MAESQFYFTINSMTTVVTDVINRALNKIALSQSACQINFVQYLLILQNIVFFLFHCFLFFCFIYSSYLLQNHFSHVER